MSSKKHTQEIENKFCPIFKPIKLVGDEWTLLIIKCLLESPKRFNEIKREIDGINNRTLSKRLKSLTEDGVLNRRLEDGNPPHAVYYLTPLGKGVEPIIAAIEQFGNQFLCE